MPYLHLIGPPIDLDTKRRLAQDLTAATLRAVRDAVPGRTTLQFTENAPEAYAAGGTLGADGAPSPVQLLLTTPHIAGRRRRARLHADVTRILIETLVLTPAEQEALDVRFAAYDPRDRRSGAMPRKRRVLPWLAALAGIAGGYVAVDRAIRSGLRTAGSAASAAAAAPATGIDEAPGAAAADGGESEAAATVSSVTTPIVGEAIAAGQIDVRSSAAVALDDTHAE